MGSEKREGAQGKSEEIDVAVNVQRLMMQLMEASAGSFELAFARYKTSEQEAALAQARRLIESEDPAERELGERLKAVALQEQQPSANLVLNAPGRNGVATDPLSRSPLPSLPAADTPSPAAEEPVANRLGSPPQSPTERNHQPPSQPQKRGPGRPRKN